MDGTGEEALLRRARAGDSQAFDGLVREHFARIYAIAHRLVGNHEDAEDLAQECFVRAHQSLGWFRGEGAFAGWLRRILVHLAQDRFRRQGRRPREEGLLPDVAMPHGERPDGDLSRREFQQLVVDSIRRLPDRLRIPLVLRTLEGMEYEDVAEAAGITLATARTQVMKARRALQQDLAPYLTRVTRGPQ